MQLEKDIFTMQCEFKPIVLGKAQQLGLLLLTWINIYAIMDK